MGTAHNIIRATTGFSGRRSAVLIFVIATALSSAAQQVSLQLDPAKTTVRFTLDAALHTVHGTFQAKHGTLQFDPASAQVSGEIVVDTKSGQTGNGMRDRKMHNEVLESDRYPEITFRPVRIEGSVANQGKSSVTIHGMFSIHGMEQEITIPAEVDMSADHWAATAHFTVPYAKWGLKNPSTLFLRVSDSVEVEVVAGGSVVKHTASSAQ